MATTKVGERTKKHCFWRCSPQVIEIYPHVKKRGIYEDPPEYYAHHLWFWLRLYAIPGESGKGSYTDGATLSRQDAKLIESSVKDVFGNFAFLYPRINGEKAIELSRALTRASRLFWKEKKENSFHAMCVITDPKNYRPLCRCLLDLLRGSGISIGDKKEINNLAGYFAIFCQGNVKVLKELAICFHSACQDRDEFRNYLPGDD